MMSEGFAAGGGAVASLAAEVSARVVGPAGVTSIRRMVKTAAQTREWMLCIELPRILRSSALDLGNAGALSSMGQACRHRSTTGKPACSDKGSSAGAHLDEVEVRWTGRSGGLPNLRNGR